MSEERDRVSHDEEEPKSRELHKRKHSDYDRERDRDRNSESPKAHRKRHRDESHSPAPDGLISRIRLLVKQADVGLIIGRGGENINALRKKYDCTLDIPSTNVKTSERILWFEPKDTDDATGILMDILPKMSDRDSREGFASEVIVLIPQCDIGAVLGKGGDHVKDLRRDTGAKIRIQRDCLPNSTERPVYIKGSYDEICQAFKLIFDDIERKIRDRGESVRDRRTILYDPVNNADVNEISRILDRERGVTRSMFGHDLLEQFRRSGETLFLLDRTGRLIPLDRDDQLLSLSDAERLGLLGREQLLDREDSYISDLLEDRLYKRELERIYASSPERGREERGYKSSRRVSGTPRSYSDKVYTGSSSSSRISGGGALNSSRTGGISKSRI